MIQSRTWYIRSTILESFRYSNLLNIVAGTGARGGFLPLPYFLKEFKIKFKLSRRKCTKYYTIKPSPIKSNLCLIAEPRGSRAIDINILKRIKCQLFSATTTTPLRPPIEIFLVEPFTVLCLSSKCRLFRLVRPFKYRGYVNGVTPLLFSVT